MRAQPPSTIYTLVTDFQRVAIYLDRRRRPQGSPYPSFSLFEANRQMLEPYEDQPARLESPIETAAHGLCNSVDHPMIEEVVAGLRPIEDYSDKALHPNVFGNAFVSVLTRARMDAFEKATSNPRTWLRPGRVLVQDRGFLKECLEVHFTDRLYQQVLIVQRLPAGPIPITNLLPYAA